MMNKSAKIVVSDVVVKLTSAVAETISSKTM